jgi:tetratricopeptide (TPR) repeat protein
MPIWSLEVEDWSTEEPIVLLEPQWPEEEQVPNHLSPIVLDRERDLIWLALGGLALQQHNETRAITFWRRAPDIANYLTGRARSVTAYAQAIRLCNLSLKIRPSVAGYYYLGNNLVEAGQLGEALLAYKEALALTSLEQSSPFEVLIYIEMGDIYRVQGSGTMARASYERALDANQDLVGAITGLARLEIAEGHADFAVTRLEDSIRRLPEYMPLHYWLARAHLELGHLGEARQTLEYLVQQGNYPYVWALLGDVARQQGDLRRALEAYNRYLELKPDDAEMKQKFFELEELLLNP